MKFIFKSIQQMTGKEFFYIARLRVNTFVTEQKITVPEFDQVDLRAIHVFALNPKGDEAMAICRIFHDLKRGWMLGRVAVNKTFRGKQLGSQMLMQTHCFLKKHGINQLSCHAQWRVKGFYQKLGYQIVGLPFQEAGIKHVMMVKKL